MKQLKIVLLSILIVMLASISVLAQVSNGATRRFEKDDLSFDYPAKWKLTDRSIPDVQSLVIAFRGGAAEIRVIGQRGPIASCNFQAENRRITNDLVEKLSTRIHAATPVQTLPVKTDLQKTFIDGVKLHGKTGGKRVTGEVYSLRVNRHFLSLVYLRADNDQITNSAWAAIRHSLTLNGGALVVSSRIPLDSRPIVSGPPIVQGLAIDLVQPSYPAIAKQAHVSGTVKIQVLIDESGDVIAAQAIDGNPLLQPAAVAAARASKFRPVKICDKPVKVNGIVAYNFVSP